MDLVLLVVLILINGIFAMSEIAVVTARKARLQNLADDGSAGAKAALALHQEPSSFLSTIQVGITSVGILSGAIGEAALADPLAQWLGGLPSLEPYARGIALTITVIALTYFSVVVGELVPKRLALLAPETIASLIARPMQALARFTHPLVVLLSGSCTAILGILGAHRKEEPPVTDDEIKVMMEQGAEAGVFHEGEQALVSNVLRLDDLRIPAIMTPRRDMFVIDLEEGAEVVRQRIVETEFTRMIVCRDGLDHILGVLQTGDLLRRVMPGHAVTMLDIEAVLSPPLYIPESVTTAQLLEHFRNARLQFALIVDEYGEVEGMVTMTDVLAAIVGDMSSPVAGEDRDMIQRDDGSWLVDGDVTLERVKMLLDIDEELPGETSQTFHTLGGLVMHILGRIPSPADHTEVAGWRIEVVDMDRNRVDKVLLARQPLSDEPEIA
jgi:putative hemolysin